VLLALSILQATLWSAWTMQHKFFHSLVKLRMDISVGNLSRDEGVHLLHSPNLIFCIEEDEKVHVWQSALLVFNGVYQSCNLPIVTLADLLQEGLLLLIEYASHQVWTVHSTLPYI
jgi:hypothetical protein